MLLKDAPKDFIWTVNSMDIEEIRKLNETYSLTAISKMYRVSVDTIRKWLLRFGYTPIRTGHSIKRPCKRDNIDIKELIKLNKTKNCSELAKIYNVTPSTINRWIENEGVKPIHHYIKPTILKTKLNKIKELCNFLKTIPNCDGAYYCQDKLDEILKIIDS